MQLLLENPDYKSFLHFLKGVYNDDILNKPLKVKIDGELQDVILMFDADTETLYLQPRERK